MKKKIKKIYPRNRNGRIDECLLDLAYAVENLQKNDNIKTFGSIYQKVAKNIPPQQ